VLSASLNVSVKTCGGVIGKRKSNGLGANTINGGPGGVGGPSDWGGLDQEPQPAPTAAVVRGEIEFGLLLLNVIVSAESDRDVKSTPAGPG
jgi:hypothetical protein